MIKWDEVSGTNLELFIYYTLGKLNFIKREWHGESGSDKGRDVVAYTYEELPFRLGYERKWVFQCKKRKRMPSITEITNDMITAAQHNMDFWVLVLSLNPTSNVIDNLYNISQRYLNGTKLIILSLAQIEEICHEYPQLIHVLYYGSLIKGDE